VKSFGTKLPLISAAVLAALPAIAAEDTSNTLEEIVVTAQFRAQNLQDTPIAITAVNAEMLEARGQTNIAQVAAQAPNVSLRPQPQNGGSGLIAFIRGVGQTDFNYALDPGVGVYVDDVYIPTLSSSLLELIDLDRIEVLRGPQGTLAGKNAIGGAIKLFSQKPKGDDTGSLRLSYGSLNEITARAMADIKLSDTVALRVSGMNRSNDGYVAMLDYGQTHPTSNVQQNNTRGNGNSDYQTMGGQNVTAARAALRFTPNEQFEINLSADYTREKSEAIPTVLIAAGATVPLSRNFNPATSGKAYSVDLLGNNRVPLLVGKNGQPIPYDCRFVPAGPYSCDTGANLQGWNKRFVSYSNFLDGMAVNPQAPYKPYFSVPTTEFYGHGFQGTLNYKLNDNAELVYIGSYRKYNSKFGQDQDASPLPLAQLDNQLDHHAFTSEVRLNMKSAGGFAEGTVGAFYLDQQGTYTARVDLNYVGPTIDFLHGPDTTPSTTKAAFGTVTLHPTDAASVTGGLRFTRDQKDYTYFRSNPDGTPVATDASCNFPFTGNTNCLLANLYNITGSFGPKKSLGLARGRRLSLHAGVLGLCLGVDGLQGRRREPPAVLRDAEAAVQSGNADDLRDGLQVRPAGSPCPRERRDLLQQVQRHHPRQAELPGIGSLPLAALRASVQHRRGGCEGRGARGHGLRDRQPVVRRERELPALQVHEHT